MPPIKKAKNNTKKTVLELCAGGGGQFLGLEKAGFHCIAAVEIEKNYCDTLSFNRPKLNVVNIDLRKFNPTEFKGVDLVAGGVPCPPFSIAGKQLGHEDDRDLFPEALRIVRTVKPRAVLLENVPGFASKKFDEYRDSVIKKLKRYGYWADWRILNASDYGAPQLRPRFVLVGIKKGYEKNFKWPTSKKNPVYVGDALFDLMASEGWKGAENWKRQAQGIGPTLVGGSNKHGGPDLGPTRARLKWKQLGVDGAGIANEPPGKDFPITGNPKLTVRMAARVQGFPDTWVFPQKKTWAYKQIGNAFPPLVATALGKAIMKAII